MKSLDFLKYHEELSYSYSYGAFVTFELINNHPKDTIAIIVDDSFIKNDKFKDLEKLTKKHNIPLFIDNKLISKLRNKDNCYVIGVFKKYKEALTNGRHIILENINELGKLGTIIRGMNGFDFKQLVLLNSSIDYFSPHVIRSSMGSFFHVKIKEYKSIEDYKKDFPNQEIYVCNEKGKSNLESIDPSIENLTLWFSDNITKEKSIKIASDLDLENNANILFFHFFNN